jgi:hypothetical protein
MNDLGDSTRSIDSGVMTIDKLLAAFDAMPKDPLAEMMKSKGFDPAKGCKMILPASLKGKLGVFPPSYVSFSGLVSDPVLFDPKAVASKPKIYCNIDAGATIKHRESIISCDI